MSHFSKSCPTCKRVLPMLCATCPQCDSRTDEARAADAAYNHMITIGLRICAVACALVIAAAISSRGRRPAWSDYQLMLLLAAVSTTTIWCALRALCGSTRRSLWRTALIPAFMIVASVFVFREVNRPPMPAAVVSASPAPAAAPLSQVAIGCFDYLREQANQASDDIESAKVRSMFGVEADGIETVQASRARLTKLDQRMLEIAAGMRKTETALTRRLRSIGPVPPSQAQLVAAVAASAKEVARSADESIAKQRQVLAKAGALLALLSDRSEQNRGGERRIIINASPNAQAYDRLLAAFDDAERTARLAHADVQQQCEQARRRIRAAGGSALVKAAAD